MQQNHRRLALVRQSNPDPINHLVGGRRRLSRPLAQTLPDDKPYYSAWTTTRSRTVAKMLAGQLGTVEVPELLQHSHHAVFRIADVVAKIANPEQISPEEAQRQLDVAIRCSEAGAPVLAPLENTLRTITQGGEQFVATLWPQLPEAEKPADPFEAGQALARLHALGAQSDVTESLAPANPCQAIDQYFSIVEHIATEAELRRLAEHVERARQSWTGLEREHGLRGVPVHFNHHQRSITCSPLADGSAGPWIYDMEHAGRGPAELDLMRAQLRVDRFGASARELEDFRAGYASVPGSLGLSNDPSLLRKLRHVWEPYVIVQRSASVIYGAPGMEAEFRLRLASLEYEPGDSRAARWTHQPQLSA